MVISGIDTKDISVVVQGAVDKFITPLCLASIREHLPGATIILSTWKETNVEGLDYDQVLLNEDPGSFDYFNTECSLQNNFDRQRHSTFQGLIQAKTPYAVKLRTDFVLKSTGFLKWFNQYPARDKQYSFFQRKVICCERYSRNPRYRHLPHLHALHPADFFFFGLTQDLIDLFDIPPIPDDDRIYFANKYPERFEYALPRFSPEQCLWISFLKKHLHDDVALPKDREDTSSRAIFLTEITFAANLIILSNEQIGIKCAKNSVYQNSQGGNNCFNHFDWLCLYHWYCKRNILFYALYILKVSGKGLFGTVAGIFRRFPYMVRDFLLEKVKPRLTPDTRALLKPIYVKVKACYFKLFSGSDNQNYIESYFDEPVTDETLSIIVQGAVSVTTKKCLESIRKVLPCAEIILSTWEGTDVDGLDYDKVIFSPDPGPNGLIRRFPHEHVHNVNRQIVSSRAGVQAASRRYSMKVRSDMLLISADFLDYYNRYSQYLSPDAPVSRRVMVEGFLTAERFPFAVSDWWYLGLTSDLERLFNIPLYPREELPYFERAENKDKKPRFADLICRFIPEQYIVYSFMRKYCPPHIREQLYFKHTFDNSPTLLDKYREFLAGSLLCLECSKSGVTLPKAKNTDNPCRYINNVPFAAWLRLCEEYRTLPDTSAPRTIQEEDKAQKTKYLTAPEYYNVADYTAIIGNYARLRNQISFPDIAPVRKDDLTFVVSGKIELSGEFNGQRCLSSIRRFFPHSRIILSTWRGEPVEALTGLYDELVLMEQPLGEQPPCYLADNPNKKKNSVNLQQISVHAGMERVTTRYAVRMRTDQYLINDNCFHFYNRWAQELNKSDNRYRLFSERVLVLRAFTHDTRAIVRPYCLSDCFQMGLTEDLLELWDGHSEPAESFIYFTEHPDSEWENPERFNHRYLAEQYFFLNALRKSRINIQLPEYYCDYSSERLTFEAEKVYASNILIGSNQQLGIAFKFRDENYPVGLTFNRLLELYLYNIEPGNETCLAYLKEQYTVPPTPKKSVVWTIMSITKKAIVSCIHTFRKGIKRIMRLILPAYRVGAGTRDRLMMFEAAEYDRFNYLSYQVNELIKAQGKQERELEQLKKQLFPREDEDKVDFKK